MKLIIIITLAMAILSLALVINAVNAYGQGQGEQKFIDRINQAKEASKEIKKGIDEDFGNVQNEPEVLAKRDKYNQTFYDCVNSGDAFMLALFGTIDFKQRDTLIDDCHFFYNETGVWVGANFDVNYTADPKVEVAFKKLNNIRQQDQIIENDIRAHQNDSALQKLFGGLFK